MIHPFSGGFLSREQKNTAGSVPIEKLPPPQHVVLPLPPCRPCVKAGEYVTAGQQVGAPAVPSAVGVHTPVAGRVRAVEPRVHASGVSVLSVVVENDLSGALCPAVHPPANPESLSRQQIAACIQNAGIVCLGSGLPVHAKIAACMGRTDTVIINACAREPMIASGHRLLAERTEEILGGARVLAKLFGVDRVHIAVENSQREILQLLRSKIEESKAPAVADLLQLQYPWNASEARLCRAVAGRKQAADCAVFDPAAAAAIYDAVYQGLPLTHRVVTVTGSGVKAPRNLLCPIGAPIRCLLDACGGVDPKTYKIILGGPMTGHAQYSMDAPVDKSADALLVFSGKEERSSAHPVCIRCGRCADVCPAGLLPFFLYQYAQAGDLAALKKARLTDCTECGACAYACPGRMHLMQAFHTGRQQLAAQKEEMV